MKYGLLGIDLDGTLLGPDHQPGAEAIDALCLARSAGLRVCLATGRSYSETISVWRQIPWTAPLEPMILIGGAMVSEPDTGRTLYQRTIPHDLGCDFADALGRHGYPAMVIVDAWRHGWDYLLCETGDMHAVQRDWFAKMDTSIRRVGRMSDAVDMPNSLRISAVVDASDAEHLASELKDQFDGRLNIHAIVAPNYEVTIVEGFAVETSKWNALKYVAQGYRISAARIAAIGDDINDLPMIREAALGAAMPDSPPDVLDAADYVATDGLVGFIQKLIAGEFDGRHDHEN